MGEVLKLDFMSKRSQLKSRRSQVQSKISADSYKNRWFKLTKHTIYYCNGKLDTGVRKVKGQIELNSILVVEDVDDDALENKKNAFQVSYKEPKSCQMFTLYIIAAHDSQREEWVKAIREGAKHEGALFQSIYHPSVWLHKDCKYKCCESINIRTRGCVASFCASQDGSSKASSFKSSKNKSENMHVLALYQFDARRNSELSCYKGDELELISNNLEEDWIKVKNSNGKMGLIPSLYVQAMDSDSLDAYEWFFKNLSRVQAENLLLQSEEEGCFLVRDSNKSHGSTLSLYYKPESKGGTTKHYQISNLNNQFYLSEKHKFLSIPQLIYYHKHNCAGLVTRLKSSPCNKVKPTILLGKTVNIEASKLQLMEGLGSGQFGTVTRGIYRGTTEVAVKIMKNATLSQFIEEAHIMAKLNHPNLVKLYGVCTDTEPIMILSEFMKNGSIDKYLKLNKAKYSKCPLKLLDMSLQVAMAMSYLEENSIIHRDLAGRNCLMGEEGVIKVCDFGLARFVLDDEYTSSEGTLFPAKWASVEVLKEQLFSSKSDVWAFGVLMWEIFTYGSSPYKNVHNENLYQHIVQDKQRLDKPGSCTHPVYTIMKSTWAERASERPDFSQITESLRKIIESDWS